MSLIVVDTPLLIWAVKREVTAGQEPMIGKTVGASLIFPPCEHGWVRNTFWLQGGWKQGVCYTAAKAIHVAGCGHGRTKRVTERITSRVN